MTTIQQTVTIPPDRRLRLDMPLPASISAGRVDIVLVIADEPASKVPPKSEERDVELFKLHAEELNKEAADVLSYQDYFWEHYGSPWDHEP
ncbi:MAG: hypothetical protein LBR23_04205 [Spirochaetaceae bacterium]|jgi:hypothetical protein|nr:hypothetical protein [Spirochaetaceae bacterium]